MKAAITVRAGPKRKRRLLQRRSQRLRLLIEYRILSALQWPLGSVFWTLEQRRGRVADKLANREIEI